MANIFAAHDIAILAGAFRPEVPTAEKASLVWNLSGDRLLQSSKLQKKFNQLLARHERIPLATLSRTLDTRQTDWCIASHQQSLVYSADRQSILSSLEADRLLSDILENAQKQYTELESFLSSHTIDKDTFKARLARPDLEILPDVHRSGKTWVASKELHAKITKDIEGLLRDSPDDHKTDLSAQLPDVPKSLLQDLAEQLAQQHGIKGTVRLGKTRITFLSAAYEAMLAEQRTKKVAQQMSKILVHTYRYGYHAVPESSEDAPGLREVFFERTREGIDSGSFAMIHSADVPIAVAFTSRLEDVLNEIRTHACDLISELWTANSSAHAQLDAGRISKLIDSSSNEEFARLVLEDTKYRKIIEQSMSERLDELERADLQRCNDAFNDYVRLPIRLYLAGLNNVKDPSLRQRLEDYVLEYMSKDLVPTGIQHLADDKQLHNGALGKELEKFRQTCLESNTLYELQTSLSKFVRKQKLNSVSTADELEVKQRILQQKLKAMKRMIRGSDILQNLVWILLAREHEGLFISSGRDTTRMIRFYQSIGDAEVGRRLEAWKDKFKAGQEAREDFEEMRLLAEQTVSQTTIHVNMGNQKAGEQAEEE
ncbi:hypothetical protein AMS68_004837 [Peltaster fructicola]|uniref:Uncharacterized protein n=1 Tax=Peltaster fructicola TaxID=286661 RepID=A0A6H0XY25_9PEZI|nr:hypothetical protein AMS68_004837 [Peltaster fructicola]